MRARRRPAAGGAPRRAGRSGCATSRSLGRVDADLAVRPQHVADLSGAAVEHLAGLEREAHRAVADGDRDASFAAARFDARGCAPLDAERLALYPDGRRAARAPHVTVDPRGGARGPTPPPRRHTA